MTPGIELHIEELVLHGRPAGDRHRVAEVLQAELTRLLAPANLAGPLLSAGTTEKRSASAFQVTLGSHGDAIGRQVARTVYRSLASPDQHAHHVEVDHEGLIR